MHGALFQCMRRKNILNSRTIKSVHKNIFGCLFSVHNKISLSGHEEVCLMRLRFWTYFSRYQDGRSISRNVASLNILIHAIIKSVTQFTSNLSITV